jgi:uncharacterized repeat protein (TIGR04076 family)
MDKDQKEKMEKRWKKLQEIQGYTDEDMAIFRSNPEFVKVMEYAPKFITHRIIVEVVEAHNCIARHKVGDKIAVMTGNAHLITDEMPKYVCAFALAAAVPRIYAIWERFHEDLDPDGLLFKTIHCPDVGCKRGGWGEIVMKVYAKEVPKELQVKLQDAKE